MPKFFKDQGYYTLSLGKVFHDVSDRAMDWSQAPWQPEDYTDWWQHPEWEKYKNPENGRGAYCESADVPDNAYADGQVAERAITELKRLKEKGQPFFMGCGFWKPHLPFNAPKKYWDLYDREKIEMADNHYEIKNKPDACNSSTEIFKYGWTGKENTQMTKEIRATDAFQREARHAYYACISYVDAQIGKVLDTLDELGLRDNTIVVLWGDHGWLLGEHRFWGKHSTLEPAMRTPFIVSAPAISGNVKTRELVESVDLFPTLCDMMGVEKPGHLEGASFLGLMKNPEQPGRDAAFGLWKNSITVKTDRYRYTEWRKNETVTERMLFDHLKDPDENVNIAVNPEYKEMMDAFSRQIDEAIPAHVLKKMSQPKKKKGK